MDTEHYLSKVYFSSAPQSVKGLSLNGAVKTIPHAGEL